MDTQNSTKSIKSETPAKIKNTINVYKNFRERQVVQIKLIGDVRFDSRQNRISRHGHKLR